MEITKQKRTLRPTAASLLQQSQANESNGKETSLCASQQKSLTPQLAKMKNSLGSINEVLTKWYNPRKQYLLQRNPTDAFMGGYPTLAELDLMFGNDSAVAWLMAQLENLNSYVGSSRKMDGEQVEETAMTIRGAFHDYKVTEIMLFFARFKEGKYGRFYGTVDPLIITNALNDFDHERIAFIDKYEQMQRASRPPKEGCVTREEFDKLEFVDVPIIILRHDENFMNYFIRPGHITVTLNGRATVKIKKTEFEAFDAWIKAGYIRIFPND